MSAPLIPRRRADVERALRAAAERSHLPLPAGPGDPWRTLLFDGETWADPAEPSQALLRAFAELHTGLDEHLALVPAQVQAAWLRERLGIAPLPGVPDRVVIAAEADPERTPLVIGAGTAVRAKDTDKRERRYTTTETLTVHGIELIDVLAHGARLLADGSVDDTAARWTDRSLPFTPFAGQAPAAHRFFVVSDILAFAGGSMDVRLTFSGAVDARALDVAEWRYSAPGDVRLATRLASTASSIDLRLSDACTEADVLGTQAAYLCASLPPGARTAAALGFAPTGVKVAVIKRHDVLPEAAFANAGKLDPTKEMQPFGPTPRRGDAFYVRSDEAFGKPLTSVKVVLSLMQAASGTITDVVWSAIPHSAMQAATGIYTSNQAGLSAQTQSIINQILDSFASEASPRVDWQRHDGDSWTTLGNTGDELKTFSWSGSTPANAPLSEPTELGGKGHFLRAFLAEGDFGWTAYQEGIADFAAEAAKGEDGNPDASKLIPPDPPIVSTVRVEYTTVAVQPAVMTSIDAWTTRRPPATGEFRPFGLPFQLGGASAGMIALGLRLSERALGTAISLYIEVESAPACGSGPLSPLRWEYWTTGGAWAPLSVADGTLGLRQPGLLRFVAPRDWPEGAAGTSAREGRWIRAVTSDTTTVGAILSITTDAVEAVHAVDPATPAGAYAPLAPKQVKGLLAAAPGVKKLTNPIAGRAGRAPEDPADSAYLRRASAVVRHRWRAATAWDCEELIRAASPEVAAVRCLPHTGRDGEDAPGWIGAVIIPRSDERLPLPSLSLAERICASLAPALAMHAQLAVLCPLYVPVSIHAGIVLTSGVAAIDARSAMISALDELLSPTASSEVGFGRELFASTLAAWLEARAEVDHLESFALVSGGAPVERVTVDACRGIVASGGDHVLTLQEQL